MKTFERNEQQKFETVCFQITNTFPHPLQIFSITFVGFFFEFTKIVLFLHQLLPILWKTIGSCVYVVEFSISFFLKWKHWCCRLILILNSLCFCFAVKQRYLSVADGKPWSPNGTHHACPNHVHASRLPVCPNQVALRHGSGIANPLACSPTLFQCGIDWCKYHCWWWKAWSSWWSRAFIKKGRGVDFEGDREPPTGHSSQGRQKGSSSCCCAVWPEVSHGETIAKRKPPSPWSSVITGKQLQFSIRFFFSLSCKKSVCFGDHV